jgi:periplasmic copper chaperone A
MRRTNLVRAGVGVAVTALAVLGFAAPASAHVTVNPNTASQGGYTKVSFRVPNETDSADTNKLEVTMPEGHPLASVSLKPVAGWTAVAEKTKLTTPIKSDDGDITEAITKITWTADATAVIKPGQFQEFDVSLGPLPTDADQLEFKALQYYSDGTIVRWIDESAPGGAEPEHPAPVLKLTKASKDGTATTNDTTTGKTTPTAEDSKDSSGNGLGVGFGIAGLVVGAIGLAFGFVAYRKASAASTTP